MTGLLQLPARALLCNFFRQVSIASVTKQYNLVLAKIKSVIFNLQLMSEELVRYGNTILWDSKSLARTFNFIHDSWSFVIGLIVTALLVQLHVVNVLQRWLVQEPFWQKWASNFVVASAIVVPTEVIV